MNSKLLTLGLTALTFGGVALGANRVLAYQGDPLVKGPNYTEERHQAMVQAFTDKDYQAWKELMAGRGRVTQVINEGNFARFAEAHQLAMEGRTEEANKIRAELGLNLRNGSGGG